MLSSDVMRGYNDTIILHILMERDSYGYEISRQIEKRSGGRYLMKEATLYSAVTRMEKRGLISAYRGEESFGRPRTYYTITEPGRRYYQEKCAEWALTKQVIDPFTAEVPEKPEGKDEANESH
ncbi:MAG: helix-turn-helix transcriptional regulator [Provencibacterium sp.]|nr:helix-turn-helix transcriptional regulator [Provencibacterium sp.]